MPQCPICRAAVWVDQQYCSTCLSPLLHPEAEDYCCPQCGLRLASQQETCQSCKVNLPEIVGALSGAPARVWRFPLKVPGIFIGAGLIIVALLLVFPFNKSPGPPQPVMTPQPQAVAEEIPTAPIIPASATAPEAPTVAVVQVVAAPSAPAASSPPAVTTPTPSMPRYFVNNDGLSVREGPDRSAPRIGALNFKDEVELLETSGGWGKVRDVRRNIVGWSHLRYLQPLAAAGPRSDPQYQPSAPKEPEPIFSKAAKDM